MSECIDIREKITPYLDGDLEGDRATVVRGHLRECADCRAVSVEEAALRDGLRALPSVDPPNAMWAGIQARMAADDVATSRQPAWRRMVDRWRANWSRTNTHLAIAGGAVVAFATVAIWWRVAHAPVEIAVAPIPAEVAPAPKAETPADVTADIADEPRRIALEYEAAANEVLALVEHARPAWSEDQKNIFDTQLAELRAHIASAAEPRDARKAWRALIRYVQSAVAREPVAMLDEGAIR